MPTATVMNTIDAFLLLVAAFLVSRIVRKRPLGPFPPGPKGLPYIGSLLDVPLTYQWLTFANWSQRWGDIFSFTLFGQRYVILNSGKHAVEILEKRSAIYSSRQSIPVAGDMIGWRDTMIMQPAGPGMRDTRKLLGIVLANPKRVARFHYLVEQETKKFLIGLHDRTDHLDREVYKLAGAIIVMIAYGYTSTGDDDVIIKTASQSMEEFAIVVAPGAFLADVFPILAKVPTWFPGAAWKRRVLEYRETLEGMVELPYRWVKEQMAAGTAPSSFASTLLEGNTDPDREHLVKYAAASLYSGGSDTSVSSMMSFFLAMSAFPEFQRKAQAELDSVISLTRLPTLADREHLPYLNAVFLELLRWIPVTPLGFPHLLTEDDIYEGYYIPKGSLVMVNIWNLLHDPERYADPMTFNPERFIATADREAEQDPRDFAFGFGRRRCPGIFFAEASIFSVLMMTLQIYNIEKPVDARGNVIEPVLEGTGALICHPVPYKVKMSVRSDKAQALLDAMTHEMQL